MAEHHVVVLKKPILFSGIVVRGREHSLHNIGIRTANLDRSTSEQISLLLTHAWATQRVNEVQAHQHQMEEATEQSTGVYYGLGKIGSSKLYPAVINVRSGANGEVVGRFDTHLIGYDPPEVTYLLPIRCAILGRLRDQKVFDSPDALRKAIQADIEKSRKLVTQPMLDEWSATEYFKSN